MVKQELDKISICAKNAQVQNSITLQRSGHFSFGSNYEFEKMGIIKNVVLSVLNIGGEG